MNSGTSFFIRKPLQHVEGDPHKQSVYLHNWNDRRARCLSYPSPLVLTSCSSVAKNPRPRLFPEVLGSQDGSWSWSQGVLKPEPTFSVYSQKFVPFVLPRVKLQGRAQKTWVPLSSTSGLESSFLGPWDHCWVLHGCLQSWSKRLLTYHRDKKVQPGVSLDPRKRWTWLSWALTTVPCTWICVLIPRSWGRSPSYFFLQLFTLSPLPNY